MKTLIISLALFSYVQLSEGQGQVQFVNFSTSRISTNSVPGGPPTGLISGPGNYYFALYVAPTNASSVSGFAFEDPLWTFTGDYGTNTSLAGRMSGNPSTSSGAVVNGYDVGSTANFVVVGWSANIGMTVADVAQWYAAPGVTGWLGESQVATNVILGGGAYPVNPIFYSGAGGLLNEVDGFTFQMIPEPMSVILAVAGLLLLGRRAVVRKNSS